MTELTERIMEIIGTPRLSALATVLTNGKPWVRYVMTVADESMTIRFASFVDARKVEQIKMNPEVHLACGVTDPMEKTPYLQIQGLARFTTDHKERHALWTDTMRSIFKGPDDPRFGVVIVEPYRIEYFVPDSYAPEVWTP